MDLSASAVLSTKKYYYFSSGTFIAGSRRSAAPIGPRRANAKVKPSINHLINHPASSSELIARGELHDARVVQHRTDYAEGSRVDVLISRPESRMIQNIRPFHT